MILEIKNIRLRVATKYPNLTNNFLVSKGITQYKLVPSLGATETYPFIGSSEIITDISSTGKTLKDNNLRVLKDGCILRSKACLLISKKGRKFAAFFKFINLIGLHSHSFDTNTHLFNFFTANFTAESDETRRVREG